MADASMTFLPPQESGRPNLGVLLTGLRYRPHIVVGDPGQRTAIVAANNHLTEPLCPVAFSDGPSQIDANVPYPVTMMLTSWPHPYYDAAVPGATFTLREGGLIVAFGTITRRWVQDHLP
jgi:hypothetical protein